MADDAKPPAKPTLGPVEPIASTPTLGTMQLPRGAQPGDDAPPVMTTVMPTPTTPVPDVAPPAMPSEWRYTIGSEIARGGMGRVVEATDTVLGRTVALKEALSADPETVRRFQRETRITARLEHPSIVPVHDAGVSPGGWPYYVMRKVSGRPLEELVAHRPALEERLALLPHIVAAAHAVAHAHGRGVVHRDIKPSNILIGDLGETIVIDWGLAKAIDETEEPADTAPRRARTRPASHSIADEDPSLRTRAGVVFGTPGFMSPEQLRGAPADERGDVYALGATLYHLLARRPPHHTKTAEGMMKAAIEGPPESLRTRVPGVPPELATIVDKALAHDPSERYQDAGALAEDLQRFLTGQLVASHHYSRRERFVRFIRKHRSLVGVTAAAAAALIIGGTVAIGRIVDERDRADDERQSALAAKRVAEEQRETATDRLDQLTLTDARHKAEQDPTRAVALIKPLAAGRLWRNARDVAAAAGAHGVAYGLPASPHTLSLELAHDGQRALAAGDDGIVRIYDLAHHSARTVADLKVPVRARFADGERKLVVFHDERITILEPGTAASREVKAPAPIVELEVSGPIAYWVDRDRAVWRLDLAGGAPARVSLDEPIQLLRPSPDGRWIALAGSAHLLLLDRTDPTLPPEAFEGDTRDLAWASDSTHLVALLGAEVVDLAMAPTPTPVHRVTVGNRQAVAYSGGRAFSAGPTGVALVARDDPRERKIAGEFTLGLREARGGAMVAGGANVLAVMSDDGDHLLELPGRISRFAASPHGPWVVAATDGLVLVWDLDAIEPRHVTQAQPSGLGFVTGDQLIASFADAPAQWIELRTGKTTTLGMLPAITSVVPAPDGQRAIVIDTTHHARLIVPAGDQQELTGDVDLAAFVDDHRVVVATTAGELRLDEDQPARHTALVTRPAGAVALAATAADRGWIVAAFADRALWRKSLGTGAESTLEVTAPPPRGGLVIAGDGMALFATGGELRAWQPDGHVTTLATLPKRIVSVALVEATRAFAATEDGGAYLVGLRRPGEVEPGRPIAAAASIALDGALIASLTPAGELELVDPLANEAWTLPKGPYLRTLLAPDGRRVLALTPTGVVVWSLELPGSAEATARWLDQMTNATADRGPSAPLGWTPPAPR